MLWRVLLQILTVFAEDKYNHLLKFPFVLCCGSWEQFFPCYFYVTNYYFIVILFWYWMYFSYSFGMYAFVFCFCHMLNLVYTLFIWLQIPMEYMFKVALTWTSDHAFCMCSQCLFTDQEARWTPLSLWQNPWRRQMTMWRVQVGFHSMLLWQEHQRPMHRELPMTLILTRAVCRDLLIFTR